MPNNIIDEQNENKFLQLLKAQRVSYNSAKKYTFLDIISIIIAITPTLLLIFNIDCKTLLAVIGVVWTIISICFSIYRDKQTKVGAIIQEEFDVELFKIPWNDILVPNKIEISEVLKLSREYKKQDLSNWYPRNIIKEFDNNIAVLLCYKVNAIWGRQLKNEFKLFLIRILIYYYGLLIVIMFIRNTGLYDIFVLIAPSIPFLVYVVSNISKQNGILETYKTIDQVINDLINKYKTNKNFPSTEKLRQIQDLFFWQRLIPQLIPNWFYNSYNKKMNGLADEAIKTIVHEIMPNSV